MAAMMVVAFVPSNAKNGSRGHYPSLQMFSEIAGPDDDTTKTEGNAKYPIPKENINPSDNTDNSPLYGTDPSNVSTSVEYDPETNSYNFQKNVDGMPIGTPYIASPIAPAIAASVSVSPPRETAFLTTSS